MAFKPKFYYEIDGVKYSRSELARKMNMSFQRLSYRLRVSKNIITAETFASPHITKRKYYLVDSNGKKISLSDFARKYNLSYTLILERYHTGCRDLNILKQQAYCLSKGDLRNGNR